MMKLNKWLPVIFLLFIWYVPRNTAPGSFFENYIILRWSTYIIIPLVVCAFLLNRLFFKQKINVANILLPVVSIFFVVVFSGIINGSSPLSIVFTVFTYLRYPMLFIVLLNTNIDLDALRFFIKIFFLLLIIQIPETFYRYFALGIRWDNIVWTMGPWGHFDLGVYMIYACALITAKNLIAQVKKLSILLVLCFFFIALIGEIKAFIFFTPIVIGFVILSCIRKGIPKKRFYTILGIVGIVAVGFIFSISQYEKVFPKSRALVKMSTALHPGSEVRIRRLSAFFDVLGETKNISNFLLGWGPGSSLRGGYLADRGKFYQFTNGYKNQLAEIFIDIGLVGMVAYYWLLFCLFYGFRKHIMIENDKTFISLNRGLMGMWIFYAFLGPVYDLVWRYDSSNFIFFFLSAVLYSRYHSIKMKIPIVNNAYILKKRRNKYFAP